MKCLRECNLSRSKIITKPFGSHNFEIIISISYFRSKLTVSQKFVNEDTHKCANSNLVAHHHGSRSYGEISVKTDFINNSIKVIKFRQSSICESVRGEHEITREAAKLFQMKMFLSK